MRAAIKAAATGLRCALTGADHLGFIHFRMLPITKSKAMNIHSKTKIEDILHQLNTNKINEILLVATAYEAFILEKDGRLVERIHDEFSEINLFYFPRITRASNTQEALEYLENQNFDLVITLANLPHNDAFELSKAVKSKRNHLPVVVLLSDPAALNRIAAPSRNSILDGVFFWSGDPSLFLAITKLVEDRQNIEDLQTELVKVILVVDDSVEYYSKFLPVVYGEVMKQTQALMKECHNEVQKAAYMRTRTKILLASNYEDAFYLFQTHRKSLLAVISDIAYPKNAMLTPDAGIQFAQTIRQEQFDMPIILMSADDHSATAKKMEITFVNKNSPMFPSDLRNFLIANMGFGDFVFRMPDGKEIARAANMKEFQTLVPRMPAESILYHARRNHISRWLMSHGNYELALRLRPRKTEEFNDDAFLLKQYLLETFSNDRASKQVGQMVRYHPKDWDSDFILVGKGSLGGKARGIAFVNYLLPKSEIPGEFSNICIKIPKTVAISSDEFDYFLDHNVIKDVLGQDDMHIAERFLQGECSQSLHHILQDFLEHVHTPIAVRSSSLLEDCQYLLMAGLYSSYLLPNNHSDIQVRLQQLLQAIKMVYASVFFRKSRNYIENTKYKLHDEKMGIVIQEVIGESQGDFIYPSFSGIAQSYNFIPFTYVDTQDHIAKVIGSTEGVVQIALGLSRMVIEQGKAMRFCPSMPQLLPQFYQGFDILQRAQTCFYALNVQQNSWQELMDHKNLVCLELEQAKPELLRFLASTLDLENQTLDHDPDAKGPKVITFSNFLRFHPFPLNIILSRLLSLFKEAMARDIEIEFAVNLQEEAMTKPTLYILQIRPLSVPKFAEKNT